MIALVALVALASAVPTALLVLLMVGAVAMAVVGGAFLIAKRGTRPRDVSARPPSYFTPDRLDRNPTTTLPFERLAAPLPLALELSDMGRRVGWVEGDVIGFRGFASDAEAAHAAWVAYRVLAQRLAREERRRPIPVDTERLTIERRGEADVVVAAGKPSATLVRPAAGSRTGADSFGFEIRLPPPTHEARMRSMANLAYRALRKSGIRWAMWTGKRRRIARQKRAAREAHEARLERAALAGMTPWRRAEAGRGMLEVQAPRAA
jgi:hypothetical protein